jgi:hypothetical protein
MEEIAEGTRSWTDDEIVDVLRAAAADLGESLSLTTLAEWGAETGAAVPSNRTFTVRFGSWSAACEAAGVERASATRGTGPAPMSPDVCWAAARKFLTACAEADLNPTLERYELLSREHGWPSRNTLVLRLGMPWKEIVRRANRHRPSADPAGDVDHHRRSQVPTVKEMLAALRSAADGEPTLTFVDYRDWAASNPQAPSPVDIRARYGSWERACRAAGLSTGPGRWTETTLVPFLVEAHQAIGNPFRVADYKDWVAAQPHPKRYPTLDPLLRTFGSWQAVCDRIGAVAGRGRYDDNAVQDALLDAVSAVDGPLTRAAYERWHQAESDEARQRPTAHAIARRFGSWGQAREWAETQAG